MNVLMKRFRLIPLCAAAAWLLCSPANVAPQARIQKSVLLILDSRSDMLGNVAELATANVFMARGGEVFTPVPNGTFLNGITRQRVMGLLRHAGVTVHET